jgi:tetratricopeptide (TPR) repeat protein
MVKTVPISSNLFQLAQLTLALQELTSQGLDESPEADLVREQMEFPWYQLSETEMDLSRGLSADLYSLSDDESPPPDAAGKNVSEAELKDAWESHDWGAVLKLMRYRPVFLTPDQIAFMRGHCWVQLGQPEVALAFFQLACKLAPDNVDYRITAGHIAAVSGRGKIAERSIAEVNDAVLTANSLQRLRLAGVLFALGESLSEARAIEVEKRVVQLIEATLQQMEIQAAISAGEAARYWLLLGICRMDLNDFHNAELALQHVLQLEPWNRQASLLLTQLTSTTANASTSAAAPGRKSLRGFGLLTFGASNRIERFPVLTIDELAPSASS